MLEPIEDDTWVPLDDPIPPHLVEPLRAAARQNGRTLNEEVNYRMMVGLGLLRPSRTH